MTAPIEPVSAEARERLLRLDGGPLLRCAWSEVVFLHLAVDPDVLQPFSPFPLDLYQGQACVSLVLFDQCRLRLARGGPLGAALTWPVRHYPFCNCRTYVQFGGEPAVLFLTEWVGNWPSVLGAQLTLRPPYRHARERYAVDHGRFQGTLSTSDGLLAINANLGADRAAGLFPPPPGSLDAFALERYTGLIRSRARPVVFRIWHRTWLQHRVRAGIEEDGLLRRTHPWYRHPEVAAANYSPGHDEVWIGRPRLV